MRLLAWLLGRCLHDTTHRVRVNGALYAVCNDCRKPLWLLAEKTTPFTMWRPRRVK